MKKTLIALALTAGATFSAMAQDIVDTAVKAGNFKTLVAAVQAAGLVDTLKGPGPFTVLPHRRSVRQDPQGHAGRPAG